MNIPFDKMDEFAVVDKYASMLEEQIREQTELWLWTHNRWKHSYEQWVSQHQ
jgi:KDO2-lipid IV(A) lauroyltransferase